LTLVGPEEDLRVVLTPAPNIASLDEIATQAWHQVDPSFTYPVLQQAEMPSSKGWDKVSQIIYRIPAAQSRTAFAIIRILNSQAYISLISGSKAAVSRRLAQISEILEAWKPAGLAPISLATRPQCAWGDQQSRELSHFVQDAMEKLLIPGIAIAIVQQGRMVYAEGFGVRETGGSERVTPTTRFMIGSSTKPLTTLMMARLIDQGAFTWNTPVRELLPGFELADPEVTRRLEMRHTVCACTGMPRRDVDFLFKFEGISPEQRLAEMRTMRPTTGFGETFQYSNLLVSAGGYAAGACFQSHSGLQSAYEGAMRQLVFAPLGMTNSFLMQDEAMRRDAAEPHALDLDEQYVPVDIVIERGLDSVAPAGGAWSTAEDMVKYLLLELGGGKTPQGEPLVSEEILRSRWSGGIKINEKVGYGLGLLQSEEQGLRVLSHGGNTLGFTSDLYFLPDQALGVVVLTNLRIANAFLGVVRQRIFEILFGAERKSDQMLSAAVKIHHDGAKGKRSRIKTDAASLSWIDKFIGEYRSPQLGPARIQRDRDRFRIDFESWGSDLGSEVQDDGARLIVLTSPPWSGAGLRFQTDGETGALVLDAGQEKYTFQRV
jgi:CubicO group peptidase (beta-lactamase class C family)